MAKRDYYEVLGVDKKANKEDIKKAYRKLAMANHPDTHPNDKNAEERFKEATEAYEILSDDEKRRNYDQFGFDAVNGQAQGWANARNDFSDIFSHFSGFDDIFGGFNPFNEFSRNTSRQQRPPSGQDLNITMNISLEEAYTGFSKKIKYKRNVRCTSCNGAGGHNIKTCPTCNGRGQVIQQNGFFTIANTCPKCKGSGKVFEHICNSCSGTGLIQKETEVEFTVPAGIKDGYYHTISGMGCESTDVHGASGNLHIIFRIMKSRFERNGNDLFIKSEISMYTACLGGDLDMNTIDGKNIKVKIPQGTQFGDILKVKGKGMPIMNSTRYGDLYINIQVTIPKNLSEKQKELLRNMETS